MIFELDFLSKEPELVAANNCFALVSQFSDIAFDAGNLKAQIAALRAMELLRQGFDAFIDGRDTITAQSKESHLETAASDSKQSAGA